nr:hypothetical protein [Xanthomonas translucens]
MDFQATKDFTVYNDFKLSARINLLNAFNFKNYSSYIYGGPDESGNYFGTGGRLDTSYVGLNTTGDINYVPRTVTFEIGAKF